MNVREYAGLSEAATAVRQVKNELVEDRGGVDGGVGGGAVLGAPPTNCRCS